MKRLLFVVLVIAAVGCKQAGGKGAEQDNVKPSSGTSADNTGKNERDRTMKTVTPTDQTGGEKDRTITQLVRKAVVDKYGATTAPGNVKIVTIDRVVTLRGPVNNESQKSTIGTIAGRVDRVTRVDNQLEVAKE